MRYVHVAGRAIGYPLYLVIALFILLPIGTLLFITIAVMVAVSLSLVPFLFATPIVTDFVQQVLQ